LLRPRRQVPGGSQKTADLHRTKGNNMQIPTDDWIETLEWMKGEVWDEVLDLDFLIDHEVLTTLSQSTPTGVIASAERTQGRLDVRGELLLLPTRSSGWARMGSRSDYLTPKTAHSWTGCSPKQACRSGQDLPEEASPYARRASQGPLRASSV
jgi:hypothetical protein